jgi:chromosome segregation ATPase
METNENVNFDAISAQLGLAKDTQAAAIEARIAELMKTEATLKETQSELTAVKIKLEGKEAELANVNSELSEVKDALKAYKDAEQAAREAEIASVIEDAIKAGKIEASAKDAWVTMANADFATVKATLASIQAREVITATIASDPANVATVEETLKDVDAQVKAAIKEKLGDVQFDKF